MEKPIIVMIILQFIYATVTISSRNAFLQGVSPRVFVVYRQAMATLIIFPVALISRKKTGQSCKLGWRAFWLIFSASLIGVTLYQNIYFEGLYLASSSVASAMANVVPAVTFVIAYVVGFEKVNKSLRSMAKILGTVICVSGAIGMSLYKGPKLLNMDFLPKDSLFSNTGSNDIWLLGCLLLFGSSCAWSIWLILQVPISASYPDHLSSTAWICFLATLQSAALALVVEPDLNTWKLDSGVVFLSCLYAALGSAISFFGQAWCISRRGPLFSATFSPLNTVIATILAPLLYNEKVYLGGLVGAFAVIFGLYIVLWGKATDIKQHNLHNNPSEETILIEDNLCVTSFKVDLEQPLLLENSSETILDMMEGSAMISCKADLENDSTK